MLFRHNLSKNEYVYTRSRKKQNTYTRRKIIGQETLRKLKIGTGVLEEYDYKIPGTKPAQIEKRTRETSIDTKSIESLCIWLNCQPSDIMEVIPNTWDNAERLCAILNCSMKELPSRVPMEEKQV